MTPLKYWDRRELHQRHAKALEAASSQFLEKLRDRVQQITDDAVRNYNPKEIR
jgi:hypothetical protein